MAEVNNMENLLRIKGALMEVCFLKKEWRLKDLLQQMLFARVSAQILAATGIGWFVNDMEIWPAELHVTVGVVRMKWRKIANADDVVFGRLPSLPPEDLPLRGLKPAKYVTMVGEMARCLAAADPLRNQTSSYWHRSAALALANIGFRKANEIAGISEFDVDALFCMPAVKTTIKRVASQLKKQSDLRNAEKKAMRLKTASHEGFVHSIVETSACELAEKLAPNKIVQAWDELQLKQKEMHVSIFEDKTKPKRRLDELRRANQLNESACKVMVHENVEMLKMKSRANQACTRSGLRLWHMFAMEVLGYDERSTLPLLSGQDIVKWLLLFNNHGTAQNYIGHVRWGCVYDNHGLSWDTPELKQALKGLKNLAVFFFQGPM